jgi:hypothetical protein
MRAECLKMGLTAIVAAIIGSLLAPVPVAAGGIDVILNEADHSFAQHVTFTLHATSDAEIVRIYVFFHAAHDEQTGKADVSPENPAAQVSVRYAHDVERFPLPPFADITFWWQIEDAVGNQLDTPPQTFRYTDNRFVWRQLSAGGISVHWVEGQGDPTFGQTALDIAQASVKDANAELRAPLPDPLDIFIYNSESNLRAATVLTGRTWVGAQARPELGAVVIAVPPAEGYTSRMKRYLPHEITHLLVYQLVTPEGYQYVPEWLDEGLATANERLPTPEYALALQEAHEADRLLSLEELCIPFSPDPRTAVLSYAQSASVARFIRERYGAGGIRELLSVYADGASCASGVEEALDISLNRLESVWGMSLEPRAHWRAWVDRAGVWLALWLLSLLVAVPMIGGTRRRSS